MYETSLISTAVNREHNLYTLYYDWVQEKKTTTEADTKQSGILKMEMENTVYKIDEMKMTR